MVSANVTIYICPTGIAVLIMPCSQGLAGFHWELASQPTGLPLGAVAPSFFGASAEGFHWSSKWTRVVRPGSIVTNRSKNKFRITILFFLGRSSGVRHDSRLHAALQAQCQIQSTDFAGF